MWLVALKKKKMSRFRTSQLHLAVQKSIVQTTAGKRKSISSSIDLGNLPRHRGHKKQKSDKTPPPKVSKPQDVTVDLDELIVNLVPPLSFSFSHPA